MDCLKTVDLPTLYLKPGEIHFAVRPTRVVTILGSCVALVMHHRGERIGAICHAMMPSMTDLHRQSEPERRFLYVDACLRWMLDRFAQYRIKPQNIETTLFGGAGLFSEKRDGEHCLAVGRRNIEMALTLINEFGLKLRARNVGGNRGRKVTFHTCTGDVSMKFMTRFPASEQTLREVIP